MNRQVRILIPFLIILFSSVVFAAGGEGGHDIHHIPTEWVLTQLVNFAIFVGLLAFFLKGAVKNHFLARREDFFAARRKAEEIKKIAEDERSLIKERLQKLETTASETVENAKRDAEELRKSILKDADLAVARIKEEAEHTAKFEVEKAKESLRLEMIEQSIEAAKAITQKNIADQDLKRLQGEFVEKIQVAR